MTETKYPHVVLDERGVAYLQGSNMKVIQLVAEKFAYGRSPEELHFEHPHLSLSEIHVALAYYWEHSGELDEQIADGLRNIGRIKDETADSRDVLMSKLRHKPLT